MTYWQTPFERELAPQVAALTDFFTKRMKLTEEAVAELDGLLCDALRAAHDHYTSEDNRRRYDY